MELELEEYLKNTPCSPFEPDMIYRVQTKRNWVRLIDLDDNDVQPEEFPFFAGAFIFVGKEVKKV